MIGLTIVALTADAGRRIIGRAMLHLLGNA